MPEQMKPPSTDLILAARKRAKHTQAKAGEIVHSNARRWREWETGQARMTPALFELYLLRTSGMIFDEGPLMRIWHNEQAANK